MLKILERRARRIVAGSGAAAAAIVFSTPLLAAAAPPQAPVPVKPYATVGSLSGLNERQYPSTDSSVLGIRKYKEQVGLRCKVRAHNIAGNNVWYLLRDKQAWISARYAAQTGTVPYCKDVQPTVLTYSQRAAEAKG
ncbi:SH3 domain-containing protein [Streptomyces sp. NPDC005181]|uniref:SH3 domain-containing protein n=1 Tax=Streptomyces sp. NPDC005181 TaxID=3156869 RepID=UPI0033B62CFD